jgi:hypothetical protein
VALPGAGAAYRIDGWSGELRPHHGARHDGGRTLLTVTLTAGETVLFTVDRSAEPAPESAPVTPEPVAEIGEWAITVESWDAGEFEVITEDRGLGYESREVRPQTAITRLDAGTGPLRPWKDIPEVGPEVSGVGEYTATCTLDEPTAGDRYLLDLGSTGGGLGSVQVNDGPVRGFDTSRPRVDVTADLQIGANTVRVRVSSSLNNRLLARGYYAKVVDIVSTFGGPGQRMQQTEVHDHGLLGPVRLLREATAG